MVSCRLWSDWTVCNGSENGYQIKHTSTGGKSEWKLTEKGKEFGIYLDTGKAHSNGTPIQQIKWKEAVVAKIKP